jgi:hypothetical protein
MREFFSWISVRKHRFTGAAAYRYVQRPVDYAFGEMSARNRYGP